MFTELMAQSGANVSAESGWDLETFLNNTTEYGQVIGGSILSLMGMIGVVWGGVLLVKKLLSEQSRDNWVRIAALILVGGAMLFGGITLILRFARGGSDTIENFGNGGGVALMDFVTQLSSVSGTGLF